ncbi:MAG: glycoside hydrolase family 3 C-terminal domain-containing protein [Sphingomonadales bacterium]|nr:glycoside hydrolase family 3 C-terminal domain-containing protein [Sphingomonadales bacterium]
MAAWLTLAAPGAAQADTPLYKRADAPVAQRVRDLLQRMTLAEKIAQLETSLPIPPVPGMPANPLPMGGIIANGKLDEAVAAAGLSNGAGVLYNAALAGTANGTETARQNNLIQHWVMAHTRLGIPVLFQNEALHGAVTGGATAFPQAVALGSTWDPALITQMFDRVAGESRAAGVPMVLAPVFDLARDPRYGRVEEMYSEDPYLTATMGVAAVEGLQGMGEAIDQRHVIATAKHFVHGQPENGTNKATSDFSQRTMREVFLKPFEAAVKVAHIGAVMPSYNENDGGVPSHVNSWLLKDILRKEWGFAGITNSDWFAVPELYLNHHVASDVHDAGVQAFNAGLDVESPYSPGFDGLAEGVKDGRVSTADIDAAVARVLTLKFRAGLFDHPYTDLGWSKATLGAASNIPLARKVADEAMVLLRNQGGLLPLDPAKIGKLAVIGPNADKARLGGYAGTPPYFVTVLDGIRHRLGDRVMVSYAEGARISEPDRDPVVNKMTPYKAPSADRQTALLAEAVATARLADVVVLVLGGNETITREAIGNMGAIPMHNLGDTDDLDLPPGQNALVRAIVALGKPTVAVVLGGHAFSAVALDKAVPAILEGWYLGQETGNAVAGVLFGDTNPSGKLPVSVARNAGQLPVYYYRKPQSRMGYVFNDNSPLYPFGFGLSYTSFTYASPVLDRASITRDGTAHVSVAVTNSGARAGDEIVEMYLHPQTSSVVQPVERLAGFARVHLGPGETRSVSFAIGPEQLAIWDRAMQHVVEPGLVDVMIGPSSADTRRVTLDVTR